ncbi:OHCU decarboxylase-domain-containing protein [Xylariales sp. PMI_506]|nr:OHCU decarboxylase-domain-containing protein [Xylariales sp. PMI_506]
MPQFTPLQLKLDVRTHRDLGFNLVSKHPVNAERPTPIPLIDRISRTAVAGTSSSGTSSTTTNMAASASSEMGATATAAAAAAPAPSLPPLSSLFTASVKTQIHALDLLFEPSTELHTLALPALKLKRVPANPGISADLPPPPPAGGAARSAASASAATIPEEPFTSYPALIQHIGGLLFQLAEDAANNNDSSSPPSSQQQQKKLHAILGSHPRLGAKKVESAQSQAEQAQLNRASSATATAEEVAAEAEKLRLLNDEYEAAFPGLRFVVFVNGRGRPAIMADMRRRIDRGDAREEEREAIRAMVDIALDRAGKLLAAN